VSDWKKLWRDSALADGLTDRVMEFADFKQTEQHFEAIYEAMEKIMEAVAADEREACAKIAEERAKVGEHGTWQAQEGLIIAQLIRSRGETKE